MIIPVNLANQSYEIVLCRGAIQKADTLINLNRRVLVVTDSGVPSEYSDAILAKCKSPTKVVIPSGEASKSMEVFSHLLKCMLDASFTRGDCVVAVGGGVVGDICGFAASCYMRGIDFYNVPTTLLSQVDSSVGGKTAIDFCGVKNVVGSFYQPKKVIIDPDTLKTLDRRQFVSGLTEAIKMACCFDEKLFSLIENSEDISRDIDEIIHGSLCIKKDVVEKDPKESHLRRVLNFGHTVGHAIESESKSLLHGECVAMGMLPMCSEKVYARLKKTLEKYGLETKIPFEADVLIPYILHDKKMNLGTVSAVFCNEIGTFEINDVTIDAVKDRLTAI